MTTLAFDIGIRNLAWCLVKKGETKHTILGWQNYDLLRGEGNEVGVQKVTCSECSAKAAYTKGGTLFCARHAASPLRDLSGVLLKKLPSLPEMKKILLAKGIVGGVAKKAVAEEKLATFYSLPIVKVKVKKALDTELTVLHDAIRKFITDHLTLFRQADKILLENQPVLKNPTMKSVQILLFATLRDLLPGPPKLFLVHASKKVQGAATGDAGYKDRKKGSEERVRKDLADKIDQPQAWKELFENHTKKNDLADAFCMCMDKISE